jgi:hypothetical protein
MMQNGAGRNAGSFFRKAPRARSASVAGAVVPATRASGMARPETPSTSVATAASLMSASSNTLCSRLMARERSWTIVFRYRVKARGRHSEATDWKPHPRTARG